MRCEKCKNSVFCVLFLVLYACGTICGILLFQLLADCENDWVLAYGWRLPLDYRLGSWIRPLVLAGILGLVGWGRSVVPVLVFCRGLLMTYVVCVLYGCGRSLLPALVRGLILIPLFFAVCKWSFDASARCRQTQFRFVRK